MISIVSTPIGNLGDITLRAIETLKECDAIICEDTRVTGNLLKKLELPKKELISFHSHSNDKKLNEILKRLEHGEHLALVSDAGTPCISDPGYKIVSSLIKRSNDSTIATDHGDCRIAATEVIPGPSAFLSALSISGLPINQFIYLGFLPLKKGRKTVLETFKEEERTIVFYESVHRIKRTLKELEGILQPERPVVICRELTKLHEEVIRTTAWELKNLNITKKGEFVVVIGK